MWPEWLLEKVANGEVTVNQVIFVLSAVMVALWGCQGIRPALLWCKGYRERKARNP